jgi:hypothetical protein
MFRGGGSALRMGRWGQVFHASSWRKEPPQVNAHGGHPSSPFFNLQTGWEKKDALDGVQETVKLTPLGAGVVQW